MSSWGHDVSVVLVAATKYKPWLMWASIKLPIAYCGPIFLTCAMDLG